MCVYIYKTFACVKWYLLEYKINAHIQITHASIKSIGIYWLKLIVLSNTCQTIFYSTF